MIMSNRAGFIRAKALLALGALLLALSALPFASHAAGLNSTAGGFLSSVYSSIFGAPTSKTGRERVAAPGAFSNTISGTIFDSSNNPLTGRNITLLQNGTVFGTVASDGSGIYTFTGLTLAADDHIVVYISGAAEKGGAFTLSGAADITTLDIDQNRLIVRSDSGTIVTNAHLKAAQSSPDGDLLAVDSVDPNNIVTTPATIGVEIWSGTIYAPGADINNGGNWINNGTFNAGTFTVTFNGTSNQTISGNNSTTFNNLKINNTGTDPNNVVSLDATNGASNDQVATLDVTAGVFDLGSAAFPSNFTCNGNGDVVTVRPGATWRWHGVGTLLLWGNVNNSGTIDFNSHGTSCPDNDDILIRSFPSGTQQTWKGNGTFSMTDVNVQDQKVPAGVALPLQILVNSGSQPIVAPNNNGWTILNTCTGPYTWIGGPDQDWSVATNWSPVRTTPATSDILIFDGTVTPAPIVDNVPNETDAQLKLTNSISATLKPKSPIATLTLSGGTGQDLDIPSGTVLTLAGSGGLTIALTGTGHECTVAGGLIFQDSAHRLTGANAGEITFAGPNGFFTAANGASGNPFGSGTDGSVVFQTGSTGNFNDGGDPFGGVIPPHAITVFNSGSTAIFRKNSAFASGRSYGNLTFDGNENFSGTGGNVTTVLNNFLIDGGSTFTMSLTPGGDLTVDGNFEDQNLLAGKFDPNGRTVTFGGGNTQQTITKAGTVALTFKDVIIDENAGGNVTLLSPVTVSGNLNLSTTDALLDLNGQTLELDGTISGPGNLKGSLTSTLQIGGVGSLGTLNFALGFRTLSQLAISRPLPSGSATLGNDLQVNTAVLTNGTVNTDGFTLSINSNVTRTSGYIIGNEQRSFSCSGLSTPCVVTFDVGTANAYSPVDEGVHVTGAVGTYAQTVKAIEGQHPSIHTAGANALQRWWTLTQPTGGPDAAPFAEVHFHYRGGAPTIGDVVGNEANYKIFQYNGSFVSFPAGLSQNGPLDHFAILLSTSSFGDFTLAEPTAVTPGTLAFLDAPYTDSETNTNHNKTITVRRSGGVDGQVSVHYATSAGTATAGSDYTDVAGDLTWADGDSTDKTFDIPIIGDTIFETDETVNLTLSVPSGGAIIGGTNPTTLKIINDDAADTNVAVDGSGNLILSDGTGTTNELITISVNGPNLVISDPSQNFACGSGATAPDTHTCVIPLASITGKIQVDGGGGNDSLTINLSGGNPFPAGGITFNGGDPTTPPGDQLTITGGSQATVTYHYDNAHDGTVAISNFGTVTFTGLEPITNTGTVNDIIFELPAGPTNAATLQDDGSVGNTISRLTGSTFETTNFTNPVSSLTVKRGKKADTVRVNGLPDFNASLAIGEAVNPFASISMSGAVSVTGSNTVKLYAGDVSGAGDISTGGGLTVNNTGTSSTLNGVISGNGGLTKEGSGTLSIGGNDTYTGSTSVSAGRLNINGSITSNTTVNPSAILGGAGTINSANTLTVTGGKIAPGTSPGILNTGNVTFDTTSTFEVEIGGTAPGNTATSYDQLKVTGTVNLGGATLQLSAFNGFVPSAGQTFTIIDNDGDGTDPIAGTFNGKGEGAIIPNFLGGTLSAQISYQGGNGNDVVLTVLAAAPEIDVQGNSISISSGDTSPATADGTDFSTASVGNSSSHTFTILNTGNAALNLTGTPKVDISGPNATDFTVTVQPGSPVAASGSTAFIIKFSPAASGARSASVSIANDDANENPYTFSIQGTGADPVCATPPAGMVAWWPAEGNGNDVMGPIYTPGALVNGLAFAPGKVGQAFSFDGVDDYVEVPDGPDVDITGALSIDAWVKPNALANQIIVSKYDTTVPSAVSYLLQMTDTGSVLFNAYQGANSRGVVTTPGAIVAGEFTHIAATFDPSTDTMKIYVNGVDSGAAAQAGSTPISAIDNTSTPFRIGVARSASVPGFTGFFSGLIDEVELFNTALSAADVAAIYNASFVGKCAPEIDVQGNGNSIPDGSTSTSTTNDTNFGNVSVGTPVTHTFTIFNTGAQPLDIIGITVGGPNSSEFVPGSLTPASPIPPSGSAQFTLTYTPTATGARKATVHISNNDSDEGDYDFAVEGGIEPPAVVPPSPQTADEGTSADFDLGSFTDPGGETESPWSVSVDWGDSSPATNFSTSTQGALGTQSHTYADNGTYKVTVTVTNKDSVAGSNTFDITVANVAPTIALSGTSTPVRCFAFTLNLGAITDPGTDTVSSAVIDWGDSTTTPISSNPANTTQTHTYSAIGPYNITVSLTDEDGTFPNAGSMSITVIDPSGTFTVNDAGDDQDFVIDGVCETQPGNGVCTLRAAIQEANASCFSGPITIDLTVVPSGIITLSNLPSPALPSMQHDMNLNGPGADNLTVDASNHYRVFSISAGTTVNINGLTIAHGNAGGGNGGGVLNDGNLTMSDCNVIGNSATKGGGIQNTDNGKLTILSGNIESNIASTGGGGIRNTGVMKVVNAVIASNGANRRGGGILNDKQDSGTNPGLLTLTNCTIVGNVADADDNNATDPCTGGQPCEGGGLYNGGTASLVNTAVGGNFLGNQTSDDIKGNSVNAASSHNLIGTGGSGGLTDGVNGNQVGVVDPKFGLGGIPEPGSPAIDRGDDCVLTDACAASTLGFSVTADRSGVARPQGPHVDIGAFELQEFVVNTTDDLNNDGQCTPLGTGNGCSLREAIDAANLTFGAAIVFGIPDTDPGCPAGVCTITPATTLPAIISKVFIDGYTQHPCPPTGTEPCSHPNTLSLDQGDDASLLIVVDGANIPEGAGLDLEQGSDETTIRGIVLTHWLTGIFINDSNRNNITGNFIGIDQTGNFPAGANGGIGIAISSDFDASSDNLIGGDFPEFRNIISGNGAAGIDIGQFGGTGVSFTTVEGNYIGTDRTGKSGVANGTHGIVVENGSEFNTIGCETLDGDNVISGNRDAGVYVTDTDSCLIEGNFIGTDCTGTAQLANGRGVVMNNVAQSLIGMPPFGNVISGNATNGVELLGGSCGSNLVLGNFIGTDVSGTVAVANGGSGIYLNGASYNTIGDGFPGDGNLISGNKDEGIALLGASDNLIQGNFIGTDVNGNVTGLGNQGHGIEVYMIAEPPAPSIENVIGGEASCGCTTAQRRINEKAAAFHPTAEARVAAAATAKAQAANAVPADVSANRQAANSPAAALWQRIAGWGAKQRQPNFTWTRTPKPGTDTRASIKGVTVKRTPGKQNSAARGQTSDAPGVGTGSGANLIAGNAGDGVRVSSQNDVDNLISENSIFSNDGLGINLGTDGVTLNDPGDADEGPNHLQNFPVITSANPGSTTVSGTLDSTPGASLTIEVFANSSCDSPSGYGEGQTFLGSIPAVEGSPGQYTFDLTTAAPLPAGQILTATATAANLTGSGSTSEFSQCFMVPISDVTLTLVGPTSVFEDSGSPLVFRFTRSNTIGPLSVTFSVGGTASYGVSGADYTATGASTFTSSSGVVDFADGQPTADVTVQPIADPNPEADETVILKVSPAGGYNVGAPNTGTGTITNDDACPTTFIVNSLGDTDDAAPGDGHCDTDGNLGNGDQCTLRAAITEANALTTCGAITIDATGVTGGIGLGSVLPNIDHDVNLKGSGANVLTVTRTSGAAFRIFTVSPGRTVTISGLTISNGSATVGGGIYNNHGNLTIDGCEITGNASTSKGGGIFNGGIGSGTAILTITNSTISGNSSAVDGGGVDSDFNGGPAALTVTNCTVSGNTANGNGGGVVVNASLATLTNVTITNNHADNDGNASGTGGGLTASGGADVTLRNTIVAGNLRGSPSATSDDANGALNTGGKNNLIGDGTGMTGISNGSNGNQVGSSGSPINAFLGSLIYNGGTTRTHGLLYNSPAIDAGDDTVTGAPLNLTKDQRGLTRPADGDLTAGIHVDIGAYERQATETRNVPIGSNVNVDINDARVSFPCVPVSSCGPPPANRGDGKANNAAKSLPEVFNPALTITDVDPSSQPAPPPGFAVGNTTNPPLPSFDVSTSASFNPPATVCFYLPVITDSGYFNNLKLFHNEGGTLVDRTSSLNFASHLACAQVSSFSVFVIAENVAPSAADATVSGQIVDDHGNPVEGAAVRMTGTQNRLTVTDAQGNYHFDDVTTNGFYVLTPSRVNFTFSPAQKTFSQLGANTEAAFSGTASSSGANPLDATEYFVRQQYLDFLGREPDESGFNFWVNNIESCGADQKCREVKRIDTSAAFFLSIESQQTGYLVYRTYEAAYGNLDGAPVPITLREFTPDSQKISKGVVVLQTGWQEKLEANKQAFMTEFVQRSRFTNAYPAATAPTQFVAALFANARVPASDPDYAAAVAQFNGASDTSDIAARARVVRRIAENQTLSRQEFNRAFVLMEYFGYLRRDPNSAPDTDFRGYNFWLDKLDQFDGNFDGAEMVKAFVNATEYRRRFPR